MRMVCTNIIILNELLTFGVKLDMFSSGSKLLFTKHDSASAMQKTSRLLKTKYFQNCCAHALHLLLMNDSVKKISELKDLLNHCRKVVTKLHIKGDLIEAELTKKNVKQDVENLLERIAKVNEILEAENKVPLCDNRESEIHRSSLTAAAFMTDEENADVQDGVTQLQKKYRHLHKECIT